LNTDAERRGIHFLDAVTKYRFGAHGHKDALDTQQQKSTPTQDIKFGTDELRED
jgi:hypothetical protein